jgi:hypothetical protein
MFEADGTLCKQMKDQLSIAKLPHTCDPSVAFRAAMRSMRAIPSGKKPHATHGGSAEMTASQRVRNRAKVVGMRLCLAALMIFNLCGRAQNLPAVPDNLKPPANEALAYQARAAGDQVYTCDGSAWVFTRPDAKLFAESGKQIGSHFAGPAWEWSDGSRVIGRAVANATPDSDSIPWLLLTATDHQGDGVMRRVSSIQRLSTKGGKAPTGGCDASHKGEEARSHYTAVYFFYTRP